MNNLTKRIVCIVVGCINLVGSISAFIMNAQINLVSGIMALMIGILCALPFFVLASAVKKMEHQEEQIETLYRNVAELKARLDPPAVEEEDALSEEKSFDFQ